VLCRGARPEWAARIARAAQGERYIYQSLLSEGAALPPEALDEVLAVMIAEGHFAMRQYGLAEAAARGALPADLVPRRFADAPPAAQPELLLLAERQLEARSDEALHRFVLGVVFGPHPAQLRAGAWWALRRVYRRDDARGEGALALTRAAIEPLFGSVAAFVPRLTAVLEDEATLREVGLYDRLAALLGSADEELLAALAAEPPLAEPLVEALGRLTARDLWPGLVDAATDLLGRLGPRGPWRASARALLVARERPGNFHYDRALAALAPDPAAG
jgi:hypothetical protein